MATEFIAKAVTPEGLVFRKPVTFLKIRTENGDIGIFYLNEEVFCKKFRKLHRLRFV